MYGYYSISKIITTFAYSPKMSTFKQQLQQEAAKKEALISNCQTESFLAFYKQQKDQILLHVNRDPHEDYYFHIDGNAENPAYYHRCLSQELQKEGLELQSRAYPGWIKYTIPKTNWINK